MAKAVALVAFALGVLAIAGNVQGINKSDGKFVESKFEYEYSPNKVVVEGQINCATCKLNSVTDLTKLKKGELEIKCRSRKNGTVTYIQPILADNGGYYSIQVEDGHQDDFCMVRVVASPDPRCNVKVPGFRSARITLRNFNGSANHDDMLNNSDQDGNALYGSGNGIYLQKILGFMNNEALPNCRKVRSKSGKLIPTVTWA